MGTSRVSSCSVRMAAAVPADSITGTISQRGGGRAEGDAAEGFECFEEGGGLKFAEKRRERAAHLSSYPARRRRQP